MTGTQLPGQQDISFNHDVQLALRSTQPPIQRELWCLPERSSSQGVKLTTLLYLVPMIRMHRAIHLLPHMSARRGASLSTWEYFTVASFHIIRKYMYMKTLTNIFNCTFQISLNADCGSVAGLLLHSASGTVVEPYYNTC
jgi:hypothetical protein